MALPSPNIAHNNSWFSNRLQESITKNYQEIENKVKRFYIRGKSLELDLPDNYGCPDIFEELKRRCGHEWNLEFIKKELEEHGRVSDSYYTCKITAMDKVLKSSKNC